MGAFINITGESEIIRNLSREVEAMKQRSREGMWEALEKTKAVALERTPIDTGKLRASCHVNVFNMSGQIVGQIYYTAGYAVYVHEILDNYHAVGQAKFLESALTDMSGQIIQIISGKVIGGLR